MTWIQVVHQIPGRTRIYSGVLRKNESRCEQLADALTAQSGIREVAVRPYTGTALVHHDRAVNAQAIVEAAARVLDVRIIPFGEPAPVPEFVPPLSSAATKFVQAFREIDRDIRRGSEGTLDFGVLASLALLGAGAAEVAATGKLPIPPWFNLAWWGIRTFVTAEHEEIQAERNQ
jgi:hypothetical protein